METINIRLAAFEGPLDLLLYLIAKHKLNLYDIPIDLLLEQYLEQMEQKMEDMRTEQKERIRLYQCVGVTGGIFLAIILL